jgi:hypothetical protein
MKRYTIRALFVLITLFAVGLGFVAWFLHETYPDWMGNSKYSDSRFPGVSFERFPQGIAFGRYSTEGHGDSSKLNCVFKEDILSIEPGVNPNLTKKQVLALIELIREEYAPVKNIDLVLDRTTVDREVVKEIARIQNLSCLDLTTAPLSETEVKLLLTIDSLQYLRVDRQNFTDDSLATLLDKSKAKVIVVGDRGWSATGDAVGQ